MTENVFYCRKCFAIYGLDETDPIGVGETMTCPVESCGATLTAEPYGAWMIGLIRAHEAGLSPEARKRIGDAARHRAHTGPTTPAGKRRCSMNALKHGGSAQVHRIPAARPGKYHACTECPYAPRKVILPSKVQLSSIVSGSMVENAIETDGNNRCASEKWIYCVQQGEILIQLANADGPEALRSIMRDLQGYAILNVGNALRQIAMDGPTVEAAIIKLDKDGNPICVGTELKPHPALKSVETHSRILGDVPLAESNLTPKSKVDEEHGDKIVNAIGDFLDSALQKSSAPRPEIPPSTSDEPTSTDA